MRQIRARISGRTHAGRHGVRRRRIRGWQRDEYVYFDNDRTVRAPFDALRLAERLGLPAGHQEQRKTA